MCKLLSKYRFVEVLVEKQRVVQREQGTVNREQEKPRMECCSQNEGNVPAPKMKYRISESPVAAAICRHGILIGWER